VAGLGGTSRYDTVETAVLTVRTDRGSTREVRYLRRRELPDPATAVPIAQHVVAAQDRLDLIAATYYGDPTAYWQIAEANSALDPEELVGPQMEGNVLVIPIPRT
jgi:nucleoid-associated protein YgaU